MLSIGKPITRYSQNRLFRTRLRRGHCARYGKITARVEMPETRKMVKLSSADLGRADDDVAQKRVRQYPKDGGHSPLGLWT